MGSRLGCSDAICQRLVTWHLSLDSHLDGGHEDDDGDNNDDDEEDVGNDGAVSDDYVNVWLPGSCHWTAILMEVRRTVMVRMFLIAIMTWHMSPDSRPFLPKILYYNDRNFHLGARMSFLTKKIFQTVCSMSRTKFTENSSPRAL